MKLACAFLLVGAVAATGPNPPILELIGTGGAVTFDSGKIEQYTDMQGNQGVSIDSRTAYDGTDVTGGCTKVDGKCVTSEIEGIEQKINGINGLLATHGEHIDTHLPAQIKTAEDALTERLDALTIGDDSLTTKIELLSEYLNQLNSTQTDIDGRILGLENELHMLGTTTTTTTTTTEPEVQHYGKHQFNPGYSCFDIMSHYALEGGPKAESGKYWIYSKYGQTGGRVQVYCDMERDGGGWALVQKGGTQGCFIDSVGQLNTPSSGDSAKMSDRDINDLLNGQMGVSRWLHGSPNWKDYAGDGRNAAPAATKIFFRGEVRSSSSTLQRPVWCGSTPSGTQQTTFDQDKQNGADMDLPQWQPISGYKSHFGFDTFMQGNAKYGESVGRNCGVVEQEYLNVAGVDNTHCSGNHYCKNVRNYANTPFKGMWFDSNPEESYRGMGSYFIGCYQEYNKLPAETSGCRLGGKPGCMDPDQPVEVCGVRQQMKDGYCNGINWDAHAHGGCQKDYELDQKEGGCRHCVNTGSSLNKMGCRTDSNSNGYEWPQLHTEGMTMWVRPEQLTPTLELEPKIDGKPLCFNKASAEANRAKADEFCMDKYGPMFRSQAAETNTVPFNGSSGCDEDNNDVEHHIVRVECIQLETYGTPAGGPPLAPASVMNVGGASHNEKKAWQDAGAPPAGPSDLQFGM